MSEDPIIKDLEKIKKILDIEDLEQDLEKIQDLVSKFRVWTDHLYKTYGQIQAGEA